MSATTTRRVFSRETEVAVDIRATPSQIWSILTNAAAFPEWTSTVLSIEGTIAPDAKIKLRSSLDPKRVFTLTVREFAPNSRLVWGDAMGKRTYALTPLRDGVVRFTMHERIGGPLFPFFAKMIPPFDESFDRFATDLKHRAESEGQKV